MLWTVGLADCPTTQHQQPPAMHNRGSNPIDGIFLPISLLDHCQSSYLAFGNAVPSNHQVLWLDIPSQCICPIKNVTIEHPLAQHLQCQDPRVVLKYNTILWDSLQHSGMAAWAQLLAVQAPQCMTQLQQVGYKIIDRTEYKQCAEKKCWKIHAGAVPWCLQVSKVINHHILYWKGMWQQCNGCTPAVLCLNSGQKKCNHKSPSQLSPWLTFQMNDESISSTKLTVGNNVENTIAMQGSGRQWPWENNLISVLRAITSATCSHATAKTHTPSFLWKL